MRHEKKGRKWGRGKRYDEGYGDVNKITEMQNNQNIKLTH